MAFFVMNLDKKLRVILRQILSGIFWCKIIWM
jgi:hypothetical protein